FAPDRGGASAFCDIEALIEHVPHRVEAFAGWNLRDPASTLGADAEPQIDKCAGATHAIPEFQLDLVDVLNQKAAQAWDAFSGLPVVIGNALLDNLNVDHRPISLFKLKQSRW